MSYLPEPPSRGEPATFAALADAFLAALPGFGDVMESLALAAAEGSFQGAYAGGTTYAKGETVISGGVFYVSLQAANTGNTPASSAAWWYNPLDAFAPKASPVFTGGSSGPASVAVAASAINCASGHIFTKTASGALTWTFTNVPAGFYAGILELTNGGTGTQTFPTGSKWASGGTPTLSASGKDLLSFYTPDGGTTWHWAVRALAVA